MVLVPSLQIDPFSHHKADFYVKGFSQNSRSEVNSNTICAQFHGLDFIFIAQTFQTNY